MTKKGLAEAIHNKIGLSKRESAEIVEYFFETMKKNLERGESIKLPKFGTFKIQHKEKRKGRNPTTGETIEINSRKSVVFKPSRFLRNLINTE